MLKKVLLYIFISLSLSASEKIIITNGEWEPYTSQKYKNYGPISQIVKEAFALQGVEVVYKFFPWKRAYYYVEKGIYDGSVGWSKTPKREKIFIYPKMFILPTETVFIYLKNTNFKWEGDVNIFKKYKLGTTLGYDYNGIIQKAIDEGKIKPDIGLDDLKNLKKLLLKRIDIFICDKAVALTLIKKYFSKEEQQKFTYEKKAYITLPLYLILKKGNLKLKEKFEKGLNQLIKSGRYDTIMSTLPE